MLLIVEAFAIFFSISAAVWYVGLAIYRGFFGDAGLSKERRAEAALIGIGPQFIFAFIPFPVGFFLVLIAFGCASWRSFDKPSLKTVALFLILATSDLVSRLALAGLVQWGLLESLP